MNSTPNVFYLDIDGMHTICYSLVKELLQFEEPLPEFEERFPEKLESILELPKQTFGNVEFYPTLAEKAACYFYFIIKNHPFLNGNKRLAVVTTYVFLRMNGYKLDVPWTDMYNFALKTADSTNDHKEEFYKTVTFIYENLKETKD